MLSGSQRFRIVTVDVGEIDIAHSQRALTWILLLILALILTTGLSWAHIRRRLSGQATVDEVKEP